MPDPDDDAAEVVAANRRFYAAFANRDLAAMDALWAHDAPVACIHPGWPALEGREAVMASWRDILGADTMPGMLRCRADRVHVLAPGAALVLCEEVIGAAVLAASNLFVLENGVWRLAHHQASPMAPRPARAPAPQRVLH